MARYCEVCGCKLITGRKYCFRHRNYAGHEPYTSQPSKFNFKLKLSILLFLFIVIIVVFLYGTFSYSNNSNNTHKSTLTNIPLNNTELQLKNDLCKKNCAEYSKLRGPLLNSYYVEPNYCACEFQSSDKSYTQTFSMS
jgi:hypothetical protein